MLQAMKTSDAKAAVDKELEKLKDLPAWHGTNAKQLVHFATLMDSCHLTKSETDKKFQKYKGLVVLRDDVVKDDSSSYAVLPSRDLPRHT